MTIDVRDYVAPGGKAPFTEWLMGLGHRETRFRILARLNRIRLGHFGDCKTLGDGLFELRLMFGPGYRVYFGREGERVVLLLGGGDKSSQGRDIERARATWAEYRRRKNA
jgi:putative addiction module killer protein